MKKLYTLITLLFATTLFAQDLVMTVAVPSGTTQCRLSGPWWGWDPAGGPVGVDNGDDTFTFTFSPAPTGDMEYLYTLDGATYEDLIDNAAGGTCTDRVNNGNLITDYFGYANRIWKVSDGNSWNETYDNCRYGALSTDENSQIDFSLYPNPSTDLITVKSPELVTKVSIYDLGGRLVLQERPNKTNFELHTNNLSKGIYIIKLNSNEKVATKKLLNQ
jgi:hypothetical protein